MAHRGESFSHSENNELTCLTRQNGPIINQALTGILANPAPPENENAAPTGIGNGNIEYEAANFTFDTSTDLLPSAIYHSPLLIGKAQETDSVILLCQHIKEVDSYTHLGLPAITASQGEWTERHSKALYQSDLSKYICIVTSNANWLHTVAGKLENQYCEKPMFIEPNAGGNSYEDYARANNVSYPAPVYDWIEREAELSDRPFEPAPFHWRPSAEIPPTDFIYGEHYIRGEVSQTTAAPGAGKSYLMLTEILAMVTGFELLGVNVETPKRVWIWGEDESRVTEGRIHGALLQHGIKQGPWCNRLFINSFRENPINLVQSEKGQVLVNTKAVTALAKWATEREIDVIVFDTLTHIHKANENDNGQMHTVCEALKSLARQANCSVEIIHHNRKGTGAEPSLDSGRGAGSIAAMVRSARVVTSMSADEGEKAGVDNHKRYFRVDDTKATHSVGSPYSLWFKRESHDLDNGENVAAVTKWKWPDAFSSLSQEAMNSFLSALKDKPMKAHYNACDWAGITLAEHMSLDLDKPSHKTQVKTILSTWLKNGVISEVKMMGDNRKEKPFYVLNNEALS